LVSFETRVLDGEPLSMTDTVAGLTPASRATSFRVGTTSERLLELFTAFDESISHRDDLIHLNLRACLESPIFV
jgi:hypothetical protein